MTRPALIVALALAVLSGRPAAQLDAPIVEVVTSRGTFAFETFPDEAPVAVARIVALASAGFYDGQRIHRAIPGFVAQFGDPQTRDPASRELWGKGAAAGSGAPLGVAELSPRRTHLKGAVGMAHPGTPDKADSQIYITLADRHDLDGHYAVIGQIVSGGEVPGLLQVGDVVLRVTVQR
jgi:peptidylprolyl isomerase/peptidyl-prolyl cis-trans isomerase B (cyclophilin B)